MHFLEQLEHLCLMKGCKERYTVEKNHQFLQEIIYHTDIAYVVPRDTRLDLLTIWGYFHSHIDIMMEPLKDKLLKLHDRISAGLGTTEFVLSGGAVRDTIASYVQGRDIPIKDYDIWLLGVSTSEPKWLSNIMAHKFSKLVNGKEDTKKLPRESFSILMSTRTLHRPPWELSLSVIFL